MVTIPKKLMLDQQLTITIDGFFNQSANYQLTFFDGTNQYKRNGSLPKGKFLRCFDSKTELYFLRSIYTSKRDQGEWQRP